jgi:hypothetical protein
MTPTIVWVKGHQDRKTAYADLSLLAQLNVDADFYAGKFQDQYGKIRPKVLRFPNNRAQLHLSGATITYKVKSFLQYADTLPALRAYIQERCKWSNSTMATIDWDAHGQALQRGIKNRVRLTKLVHDILPTNHFVHQFVDDRSCGCLSCSSDCEDRDHILRCSHPTRSRWRQSCLVAIQKTTNIQQTQPYLQAILLDGILEWFQFRTLQPGTYPNKYDKLTTRPYFYFLFFLLKKIIRVIICCNLVGGRTGTLPWRHQIWGNDGWSGGLLGSMLHGFVAGLCSFCRCIC